ncbi:MAG: hypothetical protein ACYC1I_11675 [Acidimicrobiales bacterium]
MQSPIASASTPARPDATALTASTTTDQSDSRSAHSRSASSDLSELIEKLDDMRTDAAPKESTLVFALGWPADRLDVAVKAGVEAGSIRVWEIPGESPAIMLSELEATRRGLAVHTVMKKDGSFRFKWKNFDQIERRFRAADTPRLVLGSVLSRSLPEDEDGVRGSLETIAHRSEDPGALLDAIDGYRKTLAGQKGGIRHEVFQAAAAVGIAPVGLVQRTGVPRVNGDGWSVISSAEKPLEVDDPANHPGREAFPVPGECPECKGMAGEGSAIEYCVRCDTAQTIDRLVRDEVESADVYDGKRRRGPGKRNKNGPPELNRREREIMESVSEVRSETIKGQVDRRHAKKLSDFEDLWRFDPGSTAK